MQSSIRAAQRTAIIGSPRERVGREQLAWPAALDMPFPKAGVELLQELDLLRGQLDDLVRVLLLQRQPALLARAELLVVEDLLERLSGISFTGHGLTMGIRRPGGVLRRG
jgi:hypothetical protein